MLWSHPRGNIRPILQSAKRDICQKMIGSGDVAVLLLKTQHETLQGRQAQTRTRVKDPRKKGDPTEEEGDRPADEQQSSVQLFPARFLGRCPRCARSWRRCPCEGNHSHRKQRSPVQESLPRFLDRGLEGNRSRKLSGISPEVWPAPESLQRLKIGLLLTRKKVVATCRT